MASPPDKLSQFQLYADLKEQLLICCHSECGFALSVARSQVTSHLRDKHSVPADLRAGLTHLLKREHPDFFRNPADLKVKIRVRVRLMMLRRFTKFRDQSKQSILKRKT